jgi:hypothetical protein
MLLEWTLNMPSPRLMTDADLLSECRMSIARGSGPGGQKRNKTSNAVQLTHLPTGVSVTAKESRSQQENKSRAVTRLRLKIACTVREPIDAEAASVPDYAAAHIRDRKIQISTRNEQYPAVAGLVLDLLEASSGNPANAAARLGISTSSLVKFLESDPLIWIEANRIREAVGLGPVAHRG